MKDHVIRMTALAAVLMAVVVLFAPLAAARVFAGSNIPVTIDIPVKYVVKGNASLAGGDEVTLIADDPSSPMPGGTEDGVKTINLTNEGTYSFGEIYYEKPGVHWYTIIRAVKEKKGVTKDDSIYKAKVIALNDGQGYVLVYKEGSDEKCELVYTDRVAPDTGDTGRLLIYCGMTIAAAAALALFAVSGIRNRRKEAKNGSK
jgi:hypothetical protein